MRLSIKKKWLAFCAYQDSDFDSFD